jgi:SAM-dependent methyltransferase
LHSSSLRMGQKFLEIYGNDSPLSILEIGSYDVNGSLRGFKAPTSSWLGVDLENGPGVDIVTEKGGPLPFADSTFDLVISSSVLEHDPAFWISIPEMARVMKSSGFIYINAPSNGPIHRYPVDSFRFYPDAAQSFLSLIRSEKPDANLVEAFTLKQDPGSPWNDFVCVFSGGSQTAPSSKLYESESVTNLFIDGEFIHGSFREETEDQLALTLANQHAHSLEQTIYAIKSSLSWRITKPVRQIAEIIRNKPKKKESRI